MLTCPSETTEEELRHAFQADFPDTKALRLEVDFNQNLKKLKNGDFGVVSFEEFSFYEAESLGSIEPGTFSNSYSTAVAFTFVDCPQLQFPYEDLELFTVLEFFEERGSSSQGGLTTFPHVKSASLRRLELGRNAFTSVPADVLADLPSIKRIELHAVILLFLKNPQR